MKNTALEQNCPPVTATMFRYKVDVVFCIDVTGGMGPVLHMIQANVLRLGDDLKEALAQTGRNIDSLRIRVIAFRDFGDNPATALELLDFVNLPDEETRLSSFVRGLWAGGGGDAPDSGLEALALAIKSDWGRDDDRQRHIVVFCTDTSAHPLGRHSVPTEFGSVPVDLNELTDWWRDEQFISQKAKRLVLFAPDEEPWTSIATDWEGVVYVPSQMHGGLADCSYEVILVMIKNSV